MFQLLLYDYIAVDLAEAPVSILVFVCPVMVFLDESCIEATVVPELLNKQTSVVEGGSSQSPNNKQTPSHSFTITSSLQNVRTGLDQMG